MPDAARIIYPLVMAAIMSFFMSALITAINTGVDPGYVGRWLGAWSISGPVAAVGVLLAAPLARRITAGIVGLLPRRRREA